jgi:hypothetical protein
VAQYAPYDLEVYAVVVDGQNPSTLEVDQRVWQGVIH